jgi:hypothetical protein
MQPRDHHVVSRGRNEASPVIATAICARRWDAERVHGLLMMYSRSLGPIRGTRSCIAGVLALRYAGLTSRLRSFQRS